MISTISKSSPAVTSRIPSKSSFPSTEYASPDRMTFSEKIGSIAGVGALSACPVWGITTTQMIAFELALAQDNAAHVLDGVAMANAGSTLALGVGLVVGGPLLAAGAVGLGLCGLVGAYGAHRVLEDYRV